MIPKKVELLEKKLNLSFKNRKLFKGVFIHRSFLNETKEKNLSSNERLEFLGDAVLSFLTSEFLFKEFRNLPEGELTNLRAALVRTETLASLASQFNLGDYLNLGKGEERGGGRKNQGLLANCFEALIGALYLDSGIAEVRKFLERFLFPQTEEILKFLRYLDPKSVLQEKIQNKIGLTPFYKVVKTFGPDHKKIFWVAVCAGEKTLAIGEGKSKQKAEEDAAQKALGKNIYKG